MGDRTWGQLEVLALDIEKYPDEAELLLGVINDYGLAYHGEPKDLPEGVDPLETLIIGAKYGDDQVSCGFVYGLNEVLAGKIPHATVRANEDPKYEWLGECWWHVPELGVYRQTCDAEGRPVFHASEVREAALDLSVVELERRLGGPWELAFAALGVDE